MNRRTRNKWIVFILQLTVVLWSIACVGLLITFAATTSFLALLFAAAFGVGAWWCSRLVLEFHSAVDSQDDAPTRLLRSRRRHAKEN